MREHTSRIALFASRLFYTTELGSSGARTKLGGSERLFPDGEYTGPTRILVR
jgi:hypothetical protein